MPLLVFQHQSSSLVWAVWNITEPLEWFSADLPADETLPTDISNMRKQAEWLCGRYLIKHLLTRQKIPYSGLVKDLHGKPWIKGQHHLQISVSNSFPLVAVSIHPEYPVGIDIERPRASMLEVVPRILSPHEAATIGGSLDRACMFWCAKEALFKWYGKKHVSLRQDFTIDYLPETLPGRISGMVFGERVEMSCRRIQDHILVLTEAKD